MTGWFAFINILHFDMLFFAIFNTNNFLTMQLANDDKIYLYYCSKGDFKLLKHPPHRPWQGGQFHQLHWNAGADRANRNPCRRSLEKGGLPPGCTEQFHKWSFQNLGHWLIHWVVWQKIFYNIYNIWLQK